MVDWDAERAQLSEVRNRYLEAVENHRRVWDQHQQGLASALALIEAQEAEVGNVDISLFS